jgi:hypothetical protein
MSVMAYDLLSLAERRIENARRLSKMWPLPFPPEHGDAVLGWLHELYREMADENVMEPK